MKKLFCILVIFLLSVTIAEAAFDPEEAANWLSEQKTDNIFEKSFQSLALLKYNPLVASDLALEIKKLGDNCWPSGNCDVRATSLALVALQKSEEKIDLDWLLDQQVASLSGTWYLQIDTPGSGTCSIEDEGTEYAVTVIEGKLSTSLCSATSEFDLNSCLKPTLLSTPSKELIIDCSISVTPHISLLHEEGRDYYVFKSDHTKKETIYVNNGYFNDIDSTLYANLALEELGSKINSVTWLKKNYNKNDVVHNSLLYLVTSNKYFLNQLVELQETEGHFGTEFETAIATLALAKSNEFSSALDKAYDWLGEKQVDGSVNADLLDTAIVLYSFGITEAGPVIILDCTTDAECASDYICRFGKCKKKSVTETICIVNNECELGENCENCPADCLNVGEVCCNAISYPGACCTDSDCEFDEECIAHECKEREPMPEPEKPKGIIWVILIIIFLIALLAYVYYSQFYKKGKSLMDLFKKPKRPKRPLFEPVFKPKPVKRMRIPITAPRRAPVRKSKVEEELEKSLAEAKKLLKKK